MATLTVFTPTYNRAKTLKRTYDSLCLQTSKDFVWLIIDDGSIDETREIVKQWQTEQKIAIRYIYQHNQGMHVAHNTAYRNIDTELNVCIDSDDYMPKDAVECIIESWNKYRSDKIAGIIGLDADHNGQIIGTSFDERCMPITLGEFYSNGGKGDKKLVYRTSVIKQYPEYPVFKGEKYISLGLKYQLIDQDYKMQPINKILVNVEYLQDGSSMNMYRQYVLNPKGFAFVRQQSMLLAPTFKRRFMECIHYVADCLLGGDFLFIIHSPKKKVTLLATIPGLLWYAYIRYKTKQVSK